MRESVLLEAKWLDVLLGDLLVTELEAPLASVLGVVLVQRLGILRAPSSVAYWVRALGRLLGTVTAPLSEMELELLSAAVLLDALLVLVRGLLWVATSVREWELLSEVELECESVPQLVQALEPVLAGVL
jgi:hypothetical protein